MNVSKELNKKYEEDLSKELEKKCEILNETKILLEQKSDSDLDSSDDSSSDSSTETEIDSDKEYSYVVNLVNINKLDIDLKKLKKMVNEYMIPRIDYYKSTKTKNLEIESGFSEWWIEKTSNGRRIGEGNCSFDVLTNQNNAIDVMCLCINGNQSNEKSIIQNFKNSGNNLDNYFKYKKYNNAIKIFLDDYKNKIIKFKSDRKCNNLFYLSFISTAEHVYLSCFKININNIDNVISKGATKKEKSINIQNFINDKYGCVKLYKSKKRIELRFFKKILNNVDTIIIY